TDTEGEFSFDWTGHLIEYTELGKPKLTIRQAPSGASEVDGPDGQPLLRFDYDASGGQLVAVTQVPDSSMGPASPRIIRFGYDDHGRLASVTNRVGFT